MHLTMINMFLNVIASGKCLLISIIPFKNILKLLIKIIRPQNDRAISEFYRFWIFHGGDILMKILKNFKILEKKSRLRKNS